MKIRRSNIGDIPQIQSLFYDTVTNVNKKDYTQEQIQLWASAFDKVDWKGKIKDQYFFVAEKDNKIAGFASITDKGYLDFMYIHKDFQRQGIATALLEALENEVAKFNLQEIWAEVSITARPFFKSKGFNITKIYTKKVGNVEFEDCIMTKLR